ncbi:MAG: YccF domain-containing protein [Archangium sp.]|nr:YccF domain-containing protein [Archangium sp.]MBM4784105.1 YccF domain-containing protein [Archangiaceae bacterium]
MRPLLNLLWAVLGGGIVTALEYVLAGLVLCLTIVGIPFGLQCFKLAGLALFPFGKDFDDSRPRGVTNLPLNIIWFLLAGVWICITHLTLALGLAVSIIGIPFALQHVKLAMLALMPFGVTVREVR